MSTPGSYDEANDLPTGADGVPTWEEIVDRHSDRVYRLALRLTGNRHDAEDLTQEVFVRVFRSLDTYQPGTFEGWIHRITTNLFLDHARRKQRIRFDALSDDRAARLRSAQPAPDTAYTDQTFDDDVEQALATLPPEFRAAVVLCDVEGLSYDEIAQILDAKLGTVRSRIHRGRAMLRTALAHRAPAEGRTRYQGPATAHARPVPRERLVIGHLGSRVSALLDGQMSPADEERAWEHVHTCHQCRDAVEREGWVKTRLATMQLAGASAPSHLKGSLIVRGVVDWPDLPEHPAFADSRRRHLGLSGIGGGAVGAAVMGVLALGASPANAPGAVVQPGVRVVRRQPDPRDHHGVRPRPAARERSRGAAGRAAAG